MTEIDSLEERIRELSAQVLEMRRKIADLESRQETDGGTRTSSRRGFLKLGAGAALGAAGLAAGRILPAAAANGGNVVIGSGNLGESPTTLTGDGTSGAPIPVFAAIANTTTWNPPTTGTFAGPLQGQGTSNANADGVNGWAGGSTGFAVYGVSDSGYGVVGESSTGIAVYARRSGRLLQEPLAAAGAPGYTPNNFEQVRDANGVLWINNSTGAWRRVNSPRFDAANGSGLFFKPFRLVDTRNLGGPKPAGNYTFPVAGAGPGGQSTIPLDAVGVFGNLTAVAYNAQGYLSITPTGVPFVAGTDPSTTNFIVGQYAIANSFCVGLGTGGAVDVVVTTPGTSHFVLDIMGYIQ